MKTIDLPQAREHRLTEQQRTETVRTLLVQGYSIGDIWCIAPALLAADPGEESTVLLRLDAD
jgi:hypothetical protein